MYASLSMEMLLTSCVAMMTAEVTLTFDVNYREATSHCSRVPTVHDPRHEMRIIAHTLTKPGCHLDTRTGDRKVLRLVRCGALFVCKCIVQTTPRARADDTSGEKGARRLRGGESAKRVH